MFYLKPGAHEWTLWKQLDDLDFADDIALLAHTYQQMQEKTTQLEKLAAKLGHFASNPKTKSMRMNATNTTPIMLQTETPGGGVLPIFR